MKACEYAPNILPANIMTNKRSIYNLGAVQEIGSIFEQHGTVVVACAQRDERGIGQAKFVNVDRD